MTSHSSVNGPELWHSHQFWNSTRLLGVLGLALLALTQLDQAPVLAQSVPLAGIAQVGMNAMPAGTLVVSPAGDNAAGDGSEALPFRTLTHALQVAAPNTVILLKPGIYSPQSGESFPIKLKPGVQIQGDPRTRGQGIVIKGGGPFLSPTFASQNIAVLGAHQAGLIGVTVTNPNPRGYGLWLESTSPTVQYNTFANNVHDGISITGNSRAIVQNNYFYSNGANGLTIYGTSQPEVQGNLFEKTGFGITVAQNAAPLLVGNRIYSNKDGIVLQAKAKPILRGNVIEANVRDGLVAIADSHPDLGSSNEAGNNIFRSNGRFDLNTKASSQTILSYGNELNLAQVSGKVKLPAETQPDLAQFPGSAVSVSPPSAPVVVPIAPLVAQPVQPPFISNGNPAQLSSVPVAPTINRSINVSAASFPAPGISMAQSSTRLPSVPFGASLPSPSMASPLPATIPQATTTRSVPIALSPEPIARSLPLPSVPVQTGLSVSLRPSLLPATVTVIPRQTIEPTPIAQTAIGSSGPDLPVPTPSSPSLARTGTAIVIPVPAPDRPTTERTAITSQMLRTPLVNAAATRPLTPLPRIAVLSESQKSVSSQPIEIPVPPPLAGALPSAPVGPTTSTGNKSAISSPGLLPVPGPNIPIGSGGKQIALLPPTARYRVLAQPQSEQSNDLQTQFPDAFWATVQGKAMLQLGSFSDQDKAEQLVQSLTEKGITAVWEKL